MFTVPIVLFRCKTQRSKFLRLPQITTKFPDTVAPCLCHCSHLQLDMHLKFCMTSFQWILCIFYFIREFSTFLPHWLWFPFVFSLHEDFILQSQTLYIGMHSLDTASASVSSVRRANHAFCPQSRWTKWTPLGTRLPLGNLKSREQKWVLFAWKDLITFTLFQVPCHMRVGPGSLAGAGWKLHYVTHHTATSGSLA